jgi:predicted fused transcriptional regulator/phosphomethylpyrimidine kinase
VTTRARAAIQRTDFGGFGVDFGASRHTASTFVDLSMLTQDGKVRR